MPAERSEARRAALSRALRVVPRRRARCDGCGASVAAIAEIQVHGSPLPECRECPSGKFSVEAVTACTTCADGVAGWDLALGRVCVWAWLLLMPSE